MYRNSYQRGLLTIFYSCGSKPLALWDTTTKDGYVTTFLDQDIKSMVLEIGGTNISTTYMVCPKGNGILGITMPFLVMIVKNLKKYFSFEVTILDETNTRRRFRASNFQSTTQILPLCTVMPIGLSAGWNQIQFNLAEFTRRAYKKQFVEVQKLKVNANIRVRRIYFTERLIPEEELPPAYKLYFPIISKKKKDKAPTTEPEAAKTGRLSKVMEAIPPPAAAEVAEGIPPTAEETPRGEATPAKEEIITEDVIEATPEEVAPIEEGVPTEEGALTEEGAPAEEGAPTEEGGPTEEAVPTEEGAPIEEAAVTEEGPCMCNEVIPGEGAEGAPTEEPGPCKCAEEDQPGEIQA